MQQMSATTIELNQAAPNGAGTVFVVDDDPSVRESLEGLIEATGWKVQTFGSASEFLACGRSEGPSCLILDVTLPDLDGLELQQRIAADRADMPIIIITGYADVRKSVCAMKAGAMEFLTKPLPYEPLVAAIQSALQRSSAVLREAARQQHLEDLYATLSAREREVMALVATGLMNKQVGGKLGISETTVKAHRGRMMRKMRATTLVALIEMARMLPSLKTALH